MKRRAKEWIDLPPAPEHVVKVLREVWQLQGFIVIGQPPDAPSDLRVGMKTRQIGGHCFNSLFVLAETATEDHWNRQADLIAELRPDWDYRNHFNIAGSRYFKIVPATGRKRVAA